MQLALFCYPTIPELPDQSTFFSQFVCQGPPQSVVLLETCPAVSMAGRENVPTKSPMQTETSGKRAVGWTLGGTLLMQIVTKLVVGCSHHDQKSSTPGCPTSGEVCPDLELSSAV